MGKPLALIVEDHVDAAVIFSEAMKSAGFETETVRSGDAALAKLSVIVPDIVVLDLQLPHVEGADILHQIRADERLNETRVIVATAHPHRAADLQDEADLVLIKPVGFHQLRGLGERLSPLKSVG